MVKLTEVQLPPPSVETMVDICSEPPSHEVKEAPSSDPHPSVSNENVETKNAAAVAAQVLLNPEPAPGCENAKHGDADTEQQLPPSSGEPMVDMSRELPSQEVKEAPSINTLGNDGDAKMEEAPAAQGPLNRETAYGVENAKLVEAGMELQLPPSSGEAMVEISSEPLNHDAGRESSRLAGADTELQSPPSGEAMVDTCSEPPSSQEVNEAPSSDASGNDENSKTEKTDAAVQGLLNTEPALSGKNTELYEADTEKQTIPVSAEVMVESSSEPPSQEGREAPTTDLSGDDEKAKSARAAVVAELFGDATEGGSDQPLLSPRSQGEDADADGGVE